MRELVDQRLQRRAVVVGGPLGGEAAAWLSSTSRTSARLARSRISTLVTKVPRRGIDLDQPLLRQAAEGLAQRRAADPELAPSAPRSSITAPGAQLERDDHLATAW